MGNVLCDGAPHEDDPRIHLQARQWETSMMHSCCDNPGGCLLSMFCAPCMSFHLRRRALNYDMTRYKCCQGYICPSITSTCCPGQEDCPNLCLFLEVVCCENCAISATRIYVQDERQIVTDPCDNRLIRFNNCMQLLSCLCHIAAIFHRDLIHLAKLIDFIADVVYCLTQACMQAQVDHELNLHATAADYGAPMARGPSALGAAAPGPYGAQPVATAPPAYSASDRQPLLK
ncbi:uncharacterized protein MONBRDRAFT_39192 [Monosiga brevicollis MX1]